MFCPVTEVQGQPSHIAIGSCKVFFFYSLSCCEKLPRIYFMEHMLRGVIQYLIDN